MMTNTVSTIISDETLSRIIDIESAGKPAAKASTSSALGLFQFIDKTWIDTVRKYRPEWTRGKSRAAVLLLRKDPLRSIEMGARFTEENARVIGAGYSDGDLYLAHFLGAGAARKFFRADSGASASALAGGSATRANPSILAGKTVGQVRAWAARKMKQARTDWIAHFVKEPLIDQDDAPVAAAPPPPTEDFGPMSGKPNPVTRAMQSQLNAMGYFVGDVDGRWGGKTAGGVAAFMLDRGMDGKPVIDDELLDEVAAATDEGYRRPIKSERAEATPEQLEKKLPEVASAAEAQRTSRLASFGAAVTGAATAVVGGLGDAVSYLSPIKDFVGDLPWWTWVLAACAVSLAFYYVANKSKEAKDSATAAYQEGARV